MKRITDLVVGDTVLVTENNRRFLTTIKEITPGGNYKTQDGRLFNKGGSLRGGSIWQCVNIRALTEEEIEEFKEQVAIVNKEKTRLALSKEIEELLQKNKVSFETLETIKQLIEREI